MNIGLPSLDALSLAVLISADPLLHCLCEIQLFQDVYFLTVYQTHVQNCSRVLSTFHTLIRISCCLLLQVRAFQIILIGSYLKDLCFPLAHFAVNKEQIDTSYVKKFF